MRRLLVYLLASSWLMQTATAAEDPAPIPDANDTRIRTVEYSEKTVTRLTSTDLVPITITYGDGEEPTLIAGLKVAVITPKEGADAKATAAAAASCTDWCADRHANELTLQPLRQDFGSMLVVTTRKKDGDQFVYHHYAYELMTRSGVIAEAMNGPMVSTPADPQAYFRVQYTYHAEEAARKAVEWKQAHAADLAAAQHQRVMDRLATSKFNVPLNHNWWFNDSSDCRTLGPDRVSDDGRQTTIHFRMNAPLSIPNIVAEDGKESLAQHHNDMAPDSGLMMVIHSVPGRLDPQQPAIVLRRDKMVCGLYNLGYNADASAPNTGTSSPDVVRETKP